MATAKQPAWPEGRSPANSEEFFACLEASGVLTAQAARQTIAAANLDALTAAPQTLADALVTAGQLTRLQARAILGGKVKFLVLGDYVILEKLGQGGMGKVFKAQHRRMKRTVAIKVIATAVLKQAEAVRRFEREVQAAARLIHPNIVTAFDANEFRGTHYFVMEYVAGRDLNSILAERGALPIATAVDYALQAARGLAYAHRQGVIHRDVKPGNLLVDQDGTVKILDLGLASIDRTQGGNTELTNSGQVMGTIDYMAPEQAESTRLADARSDIYSLGCTLYRLVHGEPIYSADSLVAKILAHRSLPIPALLAPLAINDDERANRLEQIFQRMVAKQPAERFASMDFVVTELESWLNDHRQATQAAKTLEATADFSGGPWTTHPGDGGSPAAVASVARPKAVASAAAEQATVNFSAIDTTPSMVAMAAPAIESTSRQHTPTKPRTRKPRQRFVAVVAGLAALLLVAAGLVFFIPTAEGTLRIEVNDPSIEVTVAETGYKIKGKTQEVTLSPGERTLRVKAGDLEFDTQKFVLGQGKNPAVVVELLPAEVRVVQNGKLLGTKKRPTKPILKEAPARAEAPAPEVVKTLAQRMAEMPAPHVDGDWQLRDGKLIVPVLGPTRMFYLRFGDLTWTDYDVEARVTVHEKWPAEFGLLARTQGIQRWQFIVGGFADMKNRDLLPFTTRDDAWNSPARRFMAGQDRVLPGSTSTVMLRVRGKTATSFFNGKEVATSEHDQLLEGRAGICTFGNTFFHDIVVRSPTGEILWQGLPELPASTDATSSEEL